MNVSVIIPSTGRTEQLLNCIEQLYKVTKDFQCVVVVDDDSRTANALLAVQDQYSHLLVVHNIPRSGPVYCWNLGAKHASGDVLVPGSDDIWFHEGWLPAALGALEELNGSGLVGINNLSGKPHKHFDEILLVTRDYCVDYQGGVLQCPHYKYICTDKEACAIAQRNNKYIYAEDSIVEHLHWRFGKSTMDDTYLFKVLDGGTKKDEAIYRKREKAGFPIDYEPWFGKETR